MKEPLPNDVDSGNEVDTISKENALATFILKPIVAYLDDLDCNKPAENESEWILNKNIALDYSLCVKDVFKTVDISFLPMPLLISKMACMHIEAMKDLSSLSLLLKGMNH